MAGIKTEGIDHVAVKFPDLKVNFSYLIILLYDDWKLKSGLYLHNVSFRDNLLWACGDKSPYEKHVIVSYEIYLKYCLCVINDSQPFVTDLVIEKFSLGNRNSWRHESLAVVISNWIWQQHGCRQACIPCMSISLSTGCFSVIVLSTTMLQPHRP